MRQVSDYLAAITRLHSPINAPNFNAMLEFVLQPFSDLQYFLNQLPQQFDIDNAIGAQLDIVGLWVGRSRNISVPIPDPYFAFDNVARGWDRGIWKGPYATPAGLASLDDETYRQLLRAKIAANSWDGTIPAAQAILDAFFAGWPATHVFIEDDGDAPLQINFFTWDDASPLRGFDEGVWYAGPASGSLIATDMQMTIGVSGKIPSIVLLSILAQNLIPLKPVGVRLNVKVTSADTMSLFGFDVAANPFIGGWDQGAWGVDPALISSLPI